MTDTADRQQFTTRDYVLIPLFTALTCAGGFLRIPVPPVPVTLQTLFVYLAGLVLGKSRGVYSQLLFLVIGLAGLPVFSGGGGPSYVLRPTFGYLLGFPLAAWWMGAGQRLHQQQRPAALAGICAAAVLSILIPGTVYLYITLSLVSAAEAAVSFQSVLFGGFLLFLPAETSKIFIALLLMKKISGYIGEEAG